MLDLNENDGCELKKKTKKAKICDHISSCKIEGATRKSLVYVYKSLSFTDLHNFIIQL